MRSWTFSHARSCEMLQTERIPSVGQLSPVGWLQDAPYSKNREHSSKDGCLGTPLRIPIGCLRHGRFDLLALGRATQGAELKWTLLRMGHHVGSCPWRPWNVAVAR